MSTEVKVRWPGGEGTLRRHWTAGARTDELLLVTSDAAYRVSDPLPSGQLAGFVALELVEPSPEGETMLGRWRGETMLLISSMYFECQRCGRRWVPRAARWPVSCPGCQSSYWDRRATEKRS